MQTVRHGSFVSRAGHNLHCGSARLTGAPSSATHPVRAGCFGQFQQTGRRWSIGTDWHSLKLKNKNNLQA
jgi:hypothetical protein